jgi:hypothetical protein
MIEEVHPCAYRDRIQCMDKHSKVPSLGTDFARQAEACRAQAKHFSQPERDLLVKIANSFDEIAAAFDVRMSRCW